MDRMNVSRSLHSLEKKNFVIRQTDELDAKRSLWKLTPAGREVYDAIFPEAYERDRRMTAAFTERELADLNRALSKAMDALD